MLLFNIFCSVNLWVGIKWWWWWWWWFVCSPMNNLIRKEIRLGEEKQIVYRWSHTYVSLTYKFSILQWCWRQYPFTRNCISDFEFVISHVVWYFLVMLHSGSHVIMRVNNLYIYIHTVPIQSFCFSLCTVFNKLHQIFNTLL